MLFALIEDIRSTPRPIQLLYQFASQGELEDFRAQFTRQLERRTLTIALLRWVDVQSVVRETLACDPREASRLTSCSEEGREFLHDQRRRVARLGPGLTRIGAWTVRRTWRGGAFRFQLEHPDGTVLATAASHVRARELAFALDDDADRRAARHPAKLAPDLVGPEPPVVDTASSLQLALFGA